MMSAIIIGTIVAGIMYVFENTGRFGYYLMLLTVLIIFFGPLFFLLSFYF